ncbi:hypothetical protein [Streptomyces sp. NPDC047841]|uniref:hypothetical protein n=1 Tax=Streptomyces sp. NPDC047841 TaxID=3154708 RepID=UPI00345331C9
MVGTAMRRVRTIRWDQVSQVVVFAEEGGLNIAADGRPMIVPTTVVGGGAPDRTEFLNAVVSPLQQRGVEVLRF